MKKPVKLLLTALAAFSLVSVADAADDIEVTADRIVADRQTQSLVATGHVHALWRPYRLDADYVEKSPNGFARVMGNTLITTCTNSSDCLHWSVSGDVEYSDGKYFWLRNATARFLGVPVLWVPYLYYPIDTLEGLRVMPGYSGRWGAFLLTKYVYNLWSSDDGDMGLRASTRLDLREKNGIALGQSLRWRLGDLGTGKFKVYYAWDQDVNYDKLSGRDGDYNYYNWGSDIDRDRYALELTHNLDLTERDIIRLRGSIFSDSYFRRDFMRSGFFSLRNQWLGYEGNELAWEHNEMMFGFGLSVGGSLNDFVQSTSRLPEGYFDVMPQSVFGTPVIYESRTLAGYLDRSYGKYGRDGTSSVYRYNPGRWADYEAGRLDTIHRLTLPMKFGDVLSVVPRIGWRGTFWSESGYLSTTGEDKAGSAGSLSRSIVEGGATLAARGVAKLNDKVEHTVEPYLDILAQEADVSSDSKRAYVFDSRDASRDWSDQFAGRSRDLPYSYYGMTPGIRNAWRKIDEEGISRLWIDFDAYIAFQFNTTDWTDGDRHHRLAESEKPNYGDDPLAMPGFSLRWFADADTVLRARAEYDTENDTLALAELRLTHRISSAFNWYTEFSQREFRWWDFSSSPYDPEVMQGDDFNDLDYSLFEVGFEQEICDAIAWSPYISWDCHNGELDTVGAWIDYRTDCLGFRLMLEYENDFTFVDGSRYDDDFSVGFFVYLRAFGPNVSSVLGGD